MDGDDSTVKLHSSLFGEGFSRISHANCGEEEGLMRVSLDR